MNLILFLVALPFGVKIGLSILFGILTFLIFVGMSLFGGNADPETGRGNSNWSVFVAPLVFCVVMIVMWNYL